MRLPRMRLTLRRVMVWVAVAAWIAFNARLFSEFFGLDSEPLPARVTSRVVSLVILAGLIGSILGIVLYNARE